MHASACRCLFAFSAAPPNTDQSGKHQDSYACPLLWISLSHDEPAVDTGTRSAETELVLLFSVFLSCLTASHVSLDRGVKLLPQRAGDPENITCPAMPTLYLLNRLLV